MEETRIQYKHPLDAKWAAFFRICKWKASYFSDNPASHFIVEIPCGHSECNGSHLIKAFIGLYESQDDARKVLPDDADSWISPHPARFGNSPENTVWYMPHGSGGGEECLANWIDDPMGKWREASKMIQNDPITFPQSFQHRDDAGNLEENLGFSSEYLTIGDHRIFISVRDGFPAEYHREYARLIVKVCNNYPHSRLVNIFDDDTNGMMNGFVGTDDPEEIINLQADLDKVIEIIYQDGCHQVFVQGVEPDTRKYSSDHYNHMDWIRRKS